ncbi:FHA domain-containing protein [Pedococcus bigeumensis]|uniref:FHA domain-containing protein n=1 Tax=Pedococcus bigeumensis TaxID=433644 RepID=A0A502D520_9MICO|nr:FHA domain-containing protein [Pedococcus bigeumensis]TPG19922.1 FHA domain-containing protein [Pedococcus bigeumensis]
MPDVIELWSLGRASLVLLQGPRMTIGRAAENDITISDPESSAVHAALEPLAGSWSVSDLSSRNGTFVNGERVLTERPLRRGDEIRIGRSRLVYRPESSTIDLAPTASPRGVPDLTRRERDVLLALFSGRIPDAVFVEPATTHEIARALQVTDAAVKQHLVKLYDKFALTLPTERTRARLANEALRRGVVSVADIRSASPGN